MLSIGIVSASGVAYYLDAVASGVDDYYLASAPGWWAGQGASHLGLEGRVEDDALVGLLGGDDPSSGRALGGRGGKVAGFDLTFSAPKSVSLLAGLADARGSARVVAAHERAVRQAMAVIESHAARGRRGAGGLRQVEVSGLTAAGFTHHTSRAGDPQLHTHVLVANRAEGSDGAWGALYGQRLFAWAKTAGHLYQAALRAELTEELGAHWGPVRNGSAELTYYRPKELTEFSQRRTEITRALATQGQSGPRAAQVATLATRPAKPAPLDPDLQVERWRERASAMGLHPDLVDSSGPLSLPGRSVTLAEADLEALAKVAVSPEGLTATKATFDLRDVLQAVADSTTDGARPAEVLAAAERLAGAAELVETASPSRFAGTRWTTAELLATEHRLLTRATAGMNAARGMVDDERMASVLAGRPSLNAEQRRMVDQLCRSGHGTEVVIGRAGTGKTFALEAAHAAWAGAGIAVIGTALSARAASELGSGTGMATVTIARLLADIDAPGGHGGLARASVVVVDEAGMVGTRTLARLAEATEAAGAKLVLVGDPRQLPELEAGGSLAALAKALPAVELTVNRRQRHAWERSALDQLRHGEVGQAVTLWRDNGRITLAPSADGAREALVDDWYRASRSGERTLMVALTRADVEDLNSRARSRLLADGRLAATGMEVGGKEYAPGDQVLSLRNDRRLGVINGGTGTVIDLDPVAGSITIALADPGGNGRGGGRAAGAAGAAGAGERSVVLPEDYLAAGHLTHGYATTVHKAQGATVSRAFVLGSSSLYREAGYTAMSRATESTDLYQVAPAPTRWQPVLGPIDELSRLLGRSRAQQLASTLVADERPTTPGASLGELHAERRAVAGRLGTDPAPNSQALRSWVGLTTAIQRREQALAAVAMADPGEHLVSRLGPPPPSGPDRDMWVRTAAAIDSYRDRYGVSGPDALGPRPADPDQGRAHDQATTYARIYDNHLDRHLDQGLSL